MLLLFVCIFETTAGWIGMVHQLIPVIHREGILL